MSWLDPEIEVRLLGVVAFLFLLYSVWMGQMTVQGLPDGYRNPVLALELVKNGADIDAIKRAEGGKAIAFMMRQTYKDFGYILLYVVLFCCLGMLLARSHGEASQWLGWAAAGCAVVAGLLDVLENRGMLKALALPDGAASNSLANSIRFSSLGKWAMLFSFCLLAGLILIGHSNLLRGTAVLLLLAGLIGLCGVGANLFRPKFYWMFPVAILLWGVGIISIAIIFTFLPARVLSGLTSN